MDAKQAGTDFSPAEPESIEAFVSRWFAAGGSERANYQLFLTELCTLLNLPQPEPAGDEAVNNSYVFERRVDIKSPEGSINRGYIDLYKRGCFVLEAKQSGKTLDSQGWDKAMLRAQNQADQYVRALTTDEGRPPFIVVADVGRSIELYSEFSRSGGTYVPYPDPGHHRIRLEDLRSPEIQQRLHLLWQQPDKLDPSKLSAQVTKEISAKLAKLARSLELQGYDVQRVAHFLKRCLFTMFSEDVGLLPGNSFTHLLESQISNPDHFSDALGALWNSMNSGGYSPVLNKTVRQFNGGLFQGIDPIQLDANQIQLLIDAAKADWRFVEPAIFGTLLERALDPRERHKLGAHFTPRAYVERLVMPTLIEPLREEWRTVQVAAEAWLQRDKPVKAIAELREFHHKLCRTRVLDPACGSGNFLYVALEHMKRLEGEVVNLIRDLSAGQASFDTEGLTVDPHQFLGLELNPRAAAIAEIVLWIGYLQWHYRIHGELDIPDPVLKDFHNIEHRDALLEYDSREPVQDENGQPVTIWDGISFKKSPTTGELIPDETGRIPVYRYTNPRRAEWPEADYILGNPPFIGGWKMRSALGDGYLEALWQLHLDIPQKADFVMYWWEKAADRVHSGTAKRFGFITTNSITQVFQRRVVERYLSDKKTPLSLTFAVPDHPWVGSNDGAAVRIAMTACAPGRNPGIRLHVIHERKTDSEEVEVELIANEGLLHADLKLGADVAGAAALRSTSNICSPGVQLYGSGFILDTETAGRLLALQDPSNTSQTVIRDYVNGRDIMQHSRGCSVIDFFGLSESEAMKAHPTAFQHVMDHVKPERLTNRRKSIRDLWWRLGWERPKLREMIKGLDRFISTTETAKHRVFVFVDENTLPDNKLINIALNDSFYLGILSSRLHTIWAMTTGSWLGVGNDSVYVKTRCFETFPFPELADSKTHVIRHLAEHLDAHRMRQLEKHKNLTLTGMYNVLEKLRCGDVLNSKEKMIHEQGLLSILKEFHDNLDRAVFEAYGWSDLADKLVGKPGATTPLPDKSAEQAEAEEELLIRLVALNTQRSVEEANGYICWLRPEYQAPGSRQTGAELVIETAENAPLAVTEGKQVWPKAMPDQVAIVRASLAKGPQTLDALATQFKRKPVKGIEQVLAALQVLGHAEIGNELWKLR